MTINDILSSIANKFNIPNQLFLTVAQLESSLNPNTTGDNNTSFGLFQLHRGGQAPANYTDAQLLDPTTNATIAAPAIASAWQILKGSFDDSTSWWSQFAALSGHPGYDPTLDASVGNNLKNIYDNNTGVSSNNTGNNTTLADTSQNNTISSLTTFFTNTGTEILLFIIAVIIVIVAISLLK